jgi:hypothetical protein
MGLIPQRAFDLASRLHAGDPSAVEEVRAALSKERTVTHAAISLGISVRCLQRWIRRYPRLTKGIAMQAPCRPTADSVAGKRQKLKTDDELG